jgi:hypothetical protein
MSDGQALTLRSVAFSVENVSDNNDRSIFNGR